MSDTTEPKREPLGPGYPGAYLTELPGIGAEPNREPIQEFDVVRTTDGNVAMVKEVSKVDGYSSLMYLHKVQPGAVYAWWDPIHLEVLWNAADIHAKITSGELMVVKTTPPFAFNGRTRRGCGVCDWTMPSMEGIAWLRWKFCPGCGAKIVEG